MSPRNHMSPSIPSRPGNPKSPRRTPEASGRTLTNKKYCNVMGSRWEGYKANQTQLNKEIAQGQIAQRHDELTLNPKN